MSYIVFALKWRPKNLDEIVGQDRVVTTLKNAIQKNKLAHAYLFAGPRGVGKTSAARILAKALNCKDAPTVNPCGKCASCIEISQSRSLDVIEIDGASNRGIDEIRTLRENVKFAPTQGKYKVYIIDEVHQITPDAFNALLKTLEEPPEFVKFIFATTQPHKVPPTILSRCQRLDFRRILVMEIIQQLEKIVAVEKIDVDKDTLFAIARSSDGSLRDAESILDQLTSFAKDKISLKDVISMLGIVEQEILFTITEKIIKKDARGALTLLNEVIDQGKDVSVFLNNLIEHFRNLMIAKISQADSQLIDLPVEICERLLQQAGAFSLEEIFSAFNTLANTQEMAKRLDSVRIPLEISLVKLTHQKHEANFKPRKIEDVNKEKKETDKDNEEYSPKETEEISKDKTQPGSCASLENVKGAWRDIIDNVGKVKMSVGTYLDRGSPIKLENNILVIGFPKDYSLHKESLERKENKEIIEKTILQLLHHNIRVNFILSSDLVHREDDTEIHPFVKSALEMFNGRVIKEK